MRPQLGITFSHLHAQSLGLDPIESLKECLSWTIIYVRLCAYWSEIEVVQGKYDFEVLEKLVALCQKYGKKVVLTVGVKTPRWPEFYFSKFVDQDLENQKTQQRLMKFIEKIIKRFKKYDCVSHWQIENEPFNPSGPQRLIIPYQLLQQECKLVRSLDSRPIVLTLWGNDLSVRRLWSRGETLADVVGLDLYYRQFLLKIFCKNFYRGPLDSDEKLKSIISNISNPVWITELQAEPWEQSDEGYRSLNPESISFVKLVKNYQRAAKLGTEVIFFWGAEYWLWRAGQGDSRYVDFVKRL